MLLFVDQNSGVLFLSSESGTTSLTGLDVISGVPILSAGTLSQLHKLSGLDILSGTPLIDSGTLEQLHALLGSDIDGELPIIDSGDLTQNHLFNGLDISSTAQISTSELTVIHVLSGLNIISGVPLIDAGVVSKGQSNLVGRDFIYMPHVIVPDILAIALSVWAYDGSHHSPEGTVIAKQDVDDIVSAVWNYERV